MFTSNRSGQYEIYSMAPDGSGLTRLTDVATDSFFPEVSPDGEHIIFFSFDPSSQNRSEWVLELWVMEADGGRPRMFGQGVLGYTTWAPEGDRIAFVGPIVAGRPDILAANLDGSDAVLLTSDPAVDREPDWSPDGQTIAFTSYRDGVPHIFLMDRDGANQRRLTSGDMVELEPDWSPDGRMIAFMSGDDVNTRIYIVNADGSGLRLLVDAPGYNENPTWSPDGSWIAFWSDRSGNREIYAIGDDGTGLIQLTDDPGEDENPSWIPARSSVAGFWMAMWTYDLPVGFWTEGDHDYFFEWSYNNPEPGGQGRSPADTSRTLTIARGPQGGETPIYSGYVLIQPWEVAPRYAWTGSACEAVSLVHPDQPTRFVWGWVNDWLMTYDEAVAHFSSFTVEAIWDEGASSAVLVMGELLPFTGPEDRWEYRCSLTQH